MADRHWVGGLDNWDAIAGSKWALTSGGAGGQAVPTSSDDVFFDAGSAGATVTVIDAAATCRNLDCSGFTGAISVVDSGITVSGSLTFASAMAWNAGGVTTTFNATSAATITSNGKTFSGAVTFNGVGGSWQMQDAFTTSSTLTLTNGTLDISGRNVLCLTLSSSNANTREIKSTASGGVLAVTSTAIATVVNCATSGGLTITRNSWGIEVRGNTTNTRTIALGGLTWPAITFTNTTANGRMDITGSNTFKSLAVSVPPQSIMFTAGTTTTIEDANGFPSGTSGNLVTIGSITAASHTLTKSGVGLVSVGFLSISRSTATPASTWFAGTSSTDGGNNSGWTFAAPSTVAPVLGNAGAFLASWEKLRPRRRADELQRSRGEFEVYVRAEELIALVAARHLDSDTDTMIADAMKEFESHYMRWDLEYVGDLIDERDRLVREREERKRKELEGRAGWLERRAKQERNKKT